MANNATFDELTVNTLNIGKTGTMKIKSAASIDMQVTSACQFIVGDTINNKKVISVNAGTVDSPDFYINGRKFTAFFGDYISDIYVNGQYVEKHSGVVDIPIGSDYVPISGGTFEGAVTFGTTNKTDIDGNVITTTTINANDIASKTLTLSSGTYSNTINQNSLIIKNNSTTVAKLDNTGLTITGTISSGNITSSGNISATGNISGSIITNNIASNSGDITFSSDITGNGAEFSTLSATTATISTLSLTNATISNAPVNNTDIANKEYVDSQISADITTALAQLNCKIEIRLMSIENGIKVCVNKNVPCTYTVLETGIIYGANITDTNAETVLNIDPDEGITKRSLNNIARKWKGDSDITIENLGLSYGIRGYMRVKLNNDTNEMVIYTNAEVTSVNQLKTYEQKLPYIWLE